MRYRKATLDDDSLLAELNHQFIRDEGHRNPMTVSELENRMRGRLDTDYEEETHCSKNVLRKLL